MAVLQDFQLRQDGRGIAHSLMAIGDIHSDAGDTTTALDYLERAAVPMHAAGDRDLVYIHEDAESVFKMSLLRPPTSRSA